MLDTRGIIAYANNFFCDMLGFEAEALTGRSYLALVGPEDLSTARLLLKEYELGDAEFFSFTLLKNDGAPLTVNVRRAALRDAKEVIYGIVATVIPLAASAATRH